MKAREAADKLSWWWSPIVAGSAGHRWRLPRGCGCGGGGGPGPQLLLPTMVAAVAAAAKVAWEATAVEREAEKAVEGAVQGSA